MFATKAVAFQIEAAATDLCVLLEFFRVIYLTEASNEIECASHRS